ncbi:50S ribosomal protein L3 [Candidatus Woesearchaeota archaeon]|nr:50S ribosomal protein L3 [Candidatus Woesearchaeota archaeon]
MPKVTHPKRGSVGYWPRKKASRPYARVRVWTTTKEAKVLGFAGYKVGMTRVTILDNRPHSPTKGEEVAMPVTILECPPLKILSAMFYKIHPAGTQAVGAVTSRGDKELARKLTLPKDTPGVDFDKMTDYDDVRLLAYTQPKMTGIGKKKPEVFELALGGKKEEKLALAKQLLGKELKVEDVFKAGSFIDIHAVSKGKGFQGPVKRFGVSIRQHKSEKVKRGPGTLGGWKSQQHFMYRVAHAGQMGYHQRTDFNKLVMAISDKPDQVNQTGGFLNYGLVRGTYLIVKGSLTGSRKRLLRLTVALRPNPQVKMDNPQITSLSIKSSQGN